MPLKELNILIGLSGSVATIKLVELVESMKEDSTKNGLYFNFRFVVTDSSKKFITEKNLDVLRNQFNVEIFDNHQEWYDWKEVGDSVLHIELRKWAHIFLIAPLSANTMAKIANGLCDNLLTCIVRAWDIRRPLFFCPAMNTCMWNHPLTERQIRELESFGYQKIGPVVKKLACGDYGCGAMAPVNVISRLVCEYARNKSIIID